MRSDLSRFTAYRTAPAKAEVLELNRRAFLRTTGGLGIAALGLLTMSRTARPVGAHQEGSPVPAATPVLGPQADGTNLWKVQVGAMVMENALDFQAFLPGEITINAGDQIWFETVMPGFHTVTFPGGSEVPPLFIPDPEAGSPTPDAPPQLVLNPTMAFPSGTTIVDGATFVSSGVDVLRDPSQHVIYTFSTPGTYDFLCIPHQSVMKAKVIVQEAGSALPLDQAGYDAQAQETLAALQEEGLAEAAKYAEATSEEQADGTTLWTAAAGAGPGQARVMLLLPKELEISAGDTVKWIIQSPGEPHTVTFVGSDATPPEDIIPGQFADGSPKLSINPQTFLPQGGNVFSGTGYLNSGYMGIPEAGLPMEFTATFDTPGEYIYYCVLHGDAEGGGMAATLRVV